MEMRAGSSKSAKQIGSLLGHLRNGDVLEKDPGCDVERTPH